jgi:hypothetical protein
MFSTVQVEVFSCSQLANLLCRALQLELVLYCTVSSALFFSDTVLTVRSTKQLNPIYHLSLSVSGLQTTVTTRLPVRNWRCQYAGASFVEAKGKDKNGGTAERQYICK